MTLSCLGINGYARKVRSESEQALTLTISGVMLRKLAIFGYSASFILVN